MRTATKLNWSCECGASGEVDIPVDTDPMDVAPTECTNCSLPLPPFTVTWLEE